MEKYKQILQKEGKASVKKESGVPIYTTCSTRIIRADLALWNPTRIKRAMKSTLQASISNTISKAQKIW